MSKNKKEKKDQEVVLPTGKANKPLDQIYKEENKVPFHSVSDLSLRLENVDAAQLQALGRKQSW